MRVEFRLRAVHVPDDYGRIAALYTRIEPSCTVTAEDIREQDTGIPTEDNLSSDPGGLLVGHGRERVLAVDVLDHAIGFGTVWRAPWTPPGALASLFGVDPAYRRQGVGTALLTHLESWGRQRKARVLMAEIPDHPTDNLLFVQTRGYAVDAHVVTSALDLASSDHGRFDSVIEMVQGTGIRFLTLADDPDGQAESKLYVLYRDTLRDNPGHVGDLPDFAQWRTEAIDASTTRKDWVLIAVEGDRYVGVTTMLPTEEPGIAYTDYTGVDRAYRGYGIALALKLLSFRAARSAGLSTMTTETEASNAPMLAVNRKLGYRPGPGRYRIIKQL